MIWLEDVLLEPLPIWAKKVSKLLVQQENLLVMD